MPETTLRRVYLVGRPKDLNNVMSLSSRGVRISLPNYTKVHAEPPDPKDIPADQAIFALDVEESRLHTQVESRNRQGGNEVTRLWEGPTNMRNLPQLKIGCIITLHEGSGPSVETRDAAKTIQDLQRANDELLDQYGALRRDFQELRDNRGAPDADALKTVINQTPASVLESMPHIGPETVEHLKSWAGE